MTRVGALEFDPKPCCVSITIKENAGQDQTNRDEQDEVVGTHEMFFL